MKLVVEQSTASDMNFQSSLFKMQTDQLGFERFEELFEKDEEDAPEEPSFDSEWRRCEVSNPMMDFTAFCLYHTLQFQKRFLHTEQPGVFVVVADVMEFAGGLSQRLRFFISYEVKCKLLTAKLMLDAGEIEIDFETFCVNEGKVLRVQNEGAKRLNICDSGHSLTFLFKQFTEIC
jgi:hypothetical protein